jgi:hypothetical protein
MPRLSPVRLDPYTLRRLKREKKCFDASHEEERNSLLFRIEGQAKKISDLEQTEGGLKARISRSIDVDVSEEAAKRSYSEGLHEGGKIAKEEIEKEKLCFDKLHHTFIDGRRPMLLHLGEVLSLVSDITLRNKDAGIVGPLMPRLLVAVPQDINVFKMDESMSMKFVREVFGRATVKLGMLGNTGKDKGGTP